MPTKKRYSNYLVTINTNIRPTSDAEAEQITEVLKEVGTEFFTLDNILECLELKGRNASVDQISRIEVSSWSVELGQNTRGQRLHIHAFIKIEHNTVIKIDAGAVRDWWVKALCDVSRCKNVYVNIRWMPATEELAKEYVEKGASKKT